MRRVLFALATAVALPLLAACSSERSVGGASTTTAGEVSTTAAASTTSIGATDSTVAPSSTVPATTPAPTTPPSAGWTVIDPSAVGAPLAYPCCASNWWGLTPSPPLPSSGGGLADGVYRISFDWPADATQPITATVSRFESCNALPAGACEDNGGGLYADDEFGVDPSGSVEISITLDSSVGIVLGGFTGNEGIGNFAAGTGTDLAELLTALDADYQTAVLDPIAAGQSKEDVVAALNATPAYGFGPPADDYAGALVYTYGDAPPLLFQGLPGVDEYWSGTRGIDVVGRIALVVEGGTLTITTYAGFYS